MAEAIESYVAMLPSRIQELERAFVGQDRGRLMQTVQALRTEAGRHGFEPIQAAAAQVEKAARQAVAEYDTIRRQLNDLIRLCLAARSLAPGP